MSTDADPFFVVTSWDNVIGIGTITSNAGTIEITRAQLAPVLDGVLFVGEYLQQSPEGYVGSTK